MDVGFFRADLRAGEDILWKNQILASGVSVVYCDDAVVDYRYFPATLRGALAKQHTYERSATIAGVGGKIRTLALMVHLALYPALMYAFRPAVLLLLLYLFYRGVLEPLRRSGRWWMDRTQILVLPALVAGLDIAAALGRLRAWIRFLR
ncbi:MAG TPA: hypothetical protein VF285_11895 [Castellaniella sp.]|uniref:hypothetical protein n=1 Tax=Castellaniella sp. TaxID=1955812 RepID=UPI002F106B86